ncbi:ankyrin repeat domain-containing protein [Salinicola endophyticus]|uniref:hypothetical protein n=1 Tax=Salinicola endophyticus TaxID=1949083 RepID=UPI0013002A5F|nr:hypothetical protein [Salinicola endophyticus]
MKELVYHLAALLTAISLAAGIFFGLPGWLGDEPESSWDSVGQFLSLLIVGIGLSLSFAVNLLAIMLTKPRPRWLMAASLLQAIPVAMTLLVLGQIAWKQHLIDQSHVQSRAIREAVEKNDARALMRARDTCIRACQREWGDQRILIEAVKVAAPSVVTAMLDANVSVSARGGEGIWTCDGAYLGQAGALAVAIAQADQKLFRILLPHSEMQARREALWIAAGLDRLAFVRMLIANGESPYIAGKYFDQHESLLHAAVEGGAVDTAHWLIVTQHLSTMRPVPTMPERHGGRTLLEVWLDYQSSNPGGRALTMIRLLKKHGFQAEPGLTRALTEELSKRPLSGRSRGLVEAGADINGLSAAERIQLAIMMMKETPSITSMREDCICAGNLVTRTRNNARYSRGVDDLPRARPRIAMGDT